MEEPDLVDAAVIFGTGFAPFRGGPLHYARTRGVDDVVARLGELAARHGASVERETSEPDEAYAEWEPSRRERPSIWDRLPWA